MFVITAQQMLISSKKLGQRMRRPVLQLGLESGLYKCLPVRSVILIDVGLWVVDDGATPVFCVRVL